MGRYETAARLSARMPKKVSLTEWAASLEPRVVLLGTDDRYSATLDPINRAIFLRASQLVCGRLEEYPSDETWFFIDEARWAGRLDGLQSLLLKGRSKGVHVVLGFQDILGMRSVYKEGVADELIGQCGNKAILKLSNPETMVWASNCFQRYEEYTPQFSSGSGGASVSHSLQTRQAMMEQEFFNFPIPTPDTGITGAFATPDGFWQCTIEPKFIARHLTQPAKIPGFIPRDIKEQDALRWPPEFLKSLTEAAQQGSDAPGQAPSPANAVSHGSAPAESRSLIAMPHHNWP
jgi:hypothetical protein